MTSATVSRPDEQELAAAGLGLRVEGPVATLTLDRPEVRNAQTPGMWRMLAAVGASLVADEAVRVVVLRGAGSTFSAGLDRAMLDPAGAGEGVETVDTPFIEAVAAVMGRRMETDDRVVVMGEDVHRLNGGTNGATRGLAARFPDRILGTPISENAFAGLAGGMAVDGRYRPVVEFMYADFMWVAADQLFNQIAKARHMYGGTGAVPLVLRSKVAMGTGYGSQHSMDPAGIFATSPGWRVVAPSTPYDYVGLMNTALRCEDPVVVLEHVDLYTSTGPGPVDDLDYCLPVGRAAVRREGSDVTVLTYLAMTDYVLQAVEEYAAVDAEVIDLRWLDRASIDWETIETSLAKTGQVLIAEQGAVGTSYGGWLADEIHRRFFDLLDAPVRRVTGSEASPSISKVLERAAIAQVAEVVAELDEIARY